MSYHIHLTQDWSYEQIAPYGEDIIKVFGKLAARFPDDVDLREIGHQLGRGAMQLWLILDEEKKFVAFVTSQMEVSQRGKKQLLLLELAGRGGVALSGVIGEIENWAKQQGAVEICPIGRFGWRRALKKMGYKALIVRYGKELV